jgi:hypothetical protein
MQIMHLVCGVNQRLVEHICLAQEDEDQEPLRAKVQPPKVAKALVEKAELVGGVLPSRFTGSDSRGVEDLRDLSLLTAMQTLSLVGVFREAYEVMAAVAGRTDPHTVDMVRDLLLTSALGAHPLDSSAVCTMARDIAARLVERSVTVW